MPAPDRRITFRPVAALTLVPVDRELFERCTVQSVLPAIHRVEPAAAVVARLRVQPNG